jgi:hypothetical protein
VACGVYCLYCRSLLHRRWGEPGQVDVGASSKAQALRERLGFVKGA